MGRALDHPGMEELDGALVEAADAQHVEQEALEPPGLDDGRRLDEVHRGPPRTAVTFTSQMMPGMEKLETWKPVQVG